MQTASSSSLPYHEPGIVTILVQSAFLLLLNLVNFILDKAVYCGLLGQVFLGVAWGTPGAKLLEPAVEGVVVQLGYLGLLLLVYQGGLSTSLRSIKANIFLSLAVAITGISLPIGSSFIFRRLSNATPIQCFAAGAALSSTSLGTTFTVLGASGLLKTRLGVVLTSAAMMDDVVGLVMVQVISILGQDGTPINAVTIVRPLLVALAFAVIAPLTCVFLARPCTVWLNTQRGNHPAGYLSRVLKMRQTAFALHTCILLACVAAATYAGTSNLFAAYVVGVSISWWDVEVPHLIKTSESQVTAPSSEDAEDSGTAREAGKHKTATPALSDQNSTSPSFSGLDIYDKYYATSVDTVLKPFFFASIGFSIPVTEMLSAEIVWKGLVYSLLMILSKLACGIWLFRFSFKFSIASLKSLTARLPKSVVDHIWGSESRKTPAASPAETPLATGDAPGPPSQSPPVRASPKSTPSPSAVTKPHASPAGVKPRSIYPASILGCAMAARGEIGFLISSMAESNKVFAASTDSRSSSDIFLVVTWAIVLCTILGPLCVGLIARRVRLLQRGVEKEGRDIQGDVLGVWGV